MRRLLLPLAMLPLIGGCSSADRDLARRQCMLPSETTGFVEAGATAIYVRGADAELHYFSKMAACPAIDARYEVGIEPRGYGPVCTGMTADLIVPAGGGATARCPIRYERELSKAEVAAFGL